MRIKGVVILLLVLLAQLRLSAAAQGPQFLTASTDERFTSLHQAYTQTTERIQGDIEALNDAKRLCKAAIDAKHDLQKRLVGEHRKYRMALLDMRQSAIASDDDDLAALIEIELEKANRLILEAEERLAQGEQAIMEPGDRLPEGLAQGLVLHYDFDRSYGTKVIDACGLGNDGKVRGARWSALGRRKGAFWFDGTDDYIETPDNESLRADGELTLSVCIFREPGEGMQTGVFEQVLSKADVAGADYRIAISANHTLGAILRHQKEGEQPIRLDADPAKRKVGVKRWVHVVLVYDGRVAHTYIDGKKDKTIVAPGGIGATNAPLNIGRCGNGSWQYGFTGRLDDVLVWKRALSEAEILGLWVSLKRSAGKSD